MTPGKSLIKHIFFCEDDEDDRHFSNEVVQEFAPGIRVDCFPNGRRLMETLEHFAPDILFLDLEMPFKNGLECLVEIRSNPLLVQLPVIVFSSTSRPSNIQTAYEIGANLFLVKTSTYAEYAASLKAVLHLNWSDPAGVREQYCVNGRYTAFC